MQLFKPINGNIEPPKVSEQEETKKVESVTLQSTSSIVNGQQTQIGQCIVPYGLNLLSSPSLSAVKGALGYDLGDLTSIYVADGTSWHQIQSETSGGYVTGPASSVDGDVAIFNGTTGKIIKDTGISSTNLVAGLTTFGTFSPNNDAGGISSNLLSLSAASTLYPGGVTTGSQAFAGLKDFSLNGIQLTASANLSGASGLFGGDSINNNGYAISKGYTFTWTGGMSTTSLGTLERIGNKLFITFASTLYSSSQGMVPLVSSPIPSIFWPTSTQYIHGINVILSYYANLGTGNTFGGAINLGAMILSTAGVLTVGSAFISNTSTGIITGVSNWPSGGASGYGQGLLPGTYSCELVS